jgi:hypothetical protein
MELATLHLRLSGDPQNTVYIQEVSPAELAVYAFMHGEECVASLKVTKVVKDLDSHEIMEGLRQKFATEYAEKALKTLFPGISPRLPNTFQSIGYDPEVLVDDTTPLRGVPDDRGRVNPSDDAAKAIQEKIRMAAATRKEENAANGKTTPAPLSAAGAPAPVAEDDLIDELDDTGGDFDDLGDDPLDDELARLEAQDKQDNAIAGA